MGSGKKLREARERPFELRKKTKLTRLRGRRGRMERFKQARERAPELRRREDTDHSENF